MRGNVICLDQCAWIELSRAYHGEVGEPQQRRVLRDMIALAKDNTALFPITYERFFETNKPKERDKRVKLAEFMVGLSRGLTFGPIGNRLVKKECHNLFVDRLSLSNPKYSFPLTLMGFGFLGILDMGLKWEKIDGKGGEFDSETDKKEKVEEYLNSKEFLIKALSDTVDDTISFKETFLGIQKECIEFTENHILDLKKDREMIDRNHMNWEDYKKMKQRQLFKDLVVPVAEEILGELKIKEEDLVLQGSPSKDWEDFYSKLPSVYTMLELFDERDRIMKGVNDPNDVHDVSFLSYCIPYASVVVTDKKWAAICRHKKLDSFFGTKIINLNEFLEGSITLDDLAPGVLG